MNSYSHNLVSEKAKGKDAGSGEETLRLIAKLPAPDGLEDRVNTGLKSASHDTRILQWPSVLRPTGSWMRGAAAAAIVFVVAGGGWGIYMRVQPNEPARVIVMPRAGLGGGFSSAGAMRTPQTLNPPVIAAPITGQTSNVRSIPEQPAQAKPLRKTPAKIVPMQRRSAKADAVNAATTRPAVSTAK